LGEAEAIDGMDFVRWIAVARVVFPQSHVRLAAGRDQMSDELQALCLLAGANSIFIGDKLLTTPLPGSARDQRLFAEVEGR
jgi:biotin synthase